MPVLPVVYSYSVYCFCEVPHEQNPKVAAKLRMRLGLRICEVSEYRSPDLRGSTVTVMKYTYVVPTSKKVHALVT